MIVSTSINTKQKRTRACATNARSLISQWDVFVQLYAVRLDVTFTLYTALFLHCAFIRMLRTAVISDLNHTCVHITGGVIHLGKINDIDKMVLWTLDNKQKNYPGVPN